jgi:methyl-accepting chemotaxis protein
MSIRKTLSFSYATIILGIFVVSILSMLMNIYQNRLNNKHELRYQSYLLAQQLRQSSDDLTRMARTYVITGDSKYEKIYQDILAIRNGLKGRPVNYDRIYWDLVLNYGDKPRPDGEKISLENLMQEAGFSPAEFAKLHEAQANSDSLVNTELIAMNAVKGLYDDGTGQFVKKGKPDLALAQKLMHDEQYHRYKAQIMKPIDDFFVLLDARTEQEVLEYKEKVRLILITIETILVILIFTAIMIGILVTRNIINKVGGEPADVVAKVAEIAEGNLTVDLQAQNQNLAGILAAMQAMTLKLRQVLQDVQKTSNNVIDGSQIMKSTSRKIAEGVITQAAATKETSTTIAKIAENVSLNAENAIFTKNMAEKAVQDATKTRQAVAKSVKAMREIAQKITMISDITRQTHLLSLNAGIEAVNSGGNGEGFAVIAKEIRGLAQRSQLVAKEINQLVNLNLAVTTIENADQMLEKLMPDIHQTTEFVYQISVDSKEYNAGIAQVNLAIQQLEKVTQDNSEIVISLTDTAEKLDEQASYLQNIISFFKT